MYQPAKNKPGMMLIEWTLASDVGVRFFYKVIYLLYFIILIYFILRLFVYVFIYLLCLLIEWTLASDVGVRFL